MAFNYNVELPVPSAGPSGGKPRQPRAPHPESPVPSGPRASGPQVPGVKSPSPGRLGAVGRGGGPVPRGGNWHSALQLSKRSVNRHRGDGSNKNKKIEMK